MIDDMEFKCWLKGKKVVLQAWGEYNYWSSTANDIVCKNSVIIVDKFVMKKVFVMVSIINSSQL